MDTRVLCNTLRTKVNNMLNTTDRTLNISSLVLHRNMNTCFSPVSNIRN